MREHGGSALAPRERVLSCGASRAGPGQEPWLWEEAGARGSGLLVSTAIPSGARVSDRGRSPPGGHGVALWSGTGPHMAPCPAASSRSPSRLLREAVSCTAQSHGACGTVRSHRRVCPRHVMSPAGVSPAGVSPAGVSPVGVPLACGVVSGCVASGCALLVQQLLVAREQGTPGAESAAAANQ